MKKKAALENFLAVCLCRYYIKNIKKKRDEEQINKNILHNNYNFPC
jgi:hypothetical protein